MGQHMEWQNVRLSTHFSLHELCASAKFPRLVVPPSPVVIHWLTWWAREGLEPIREEIGRTDVDSGYRNRLLNRAVGGVDDSLHQIMINGVFAGCATDIVPRELRLDEAFRRIAALPSSVPIRGVIIYPYRGFIHVDSRDAVRRRFFISPSKGTYQEIDLLQAMKYVLPQSKLTR